MKKTLYAKYNRIRVKEFQTKVEILEIDGENQVVRIPLTEEAAGHVNKILETYKTYPDYYNRIRLEKVTAYGKGVMGEYITGKSLTKSLEEYLGKEEELFDKIKEALDLILDINEKYCAPFSFTEEFRQIFGNIEGVETYEGDGVSVCNLDPIFDNVIQTENGTVAIDYEWMYPVMVPKQFLVYRVLKIFYEINAVELKERYTLEAFLEKCGLEMPYLEMFINIEEGFLQHVYGINKEAIYTERYKREVESLDLGKIEREEKRLEDDRAGLERIIYEQEEQLTLKTEYINVLENLLEDAKKYAEPVKKVLALPRRVVGKIMPKK